MKIVKTIYYFPAVCLIIPIDYVIWNLNIAPTFNYSTKSFKQVITENWKMYKEKINE